MRMVGLKAETVSTPAVERFLSSLPFGDTTSFTGFGITFSGHKCYVLTVYSDAFVYDIEEKVWYIWNDWQLGLSSPQPTYATANSGSSPYIQFNSGGKLYQLSDLDFQDQNGPFAFQLYTPNFDGGSRFRKYVNQLELCTDQVPGSQLSIRFSDDDYQTWSDFRTFDLGVERPIQQDWGTFRRRAHHFYQKHNSHLRIRSVDLHIDLGTL